MQFVLVVWVYKSKEDEAINILTCHRCIHDQKREYSRSRREHCTSPPLKSARKSISDFLEWIICSAVICVRALAILIKSKWKYIKRRCSLTNTWRYFLEMMHSNLLGTTTCDEINNTYFLNSRSYWRKIILYFSWLISKLLNKNCINWKTKRASI